MGTLSPMTWVPCQKCHGYGENDMGMAKVTWVWHPQLQSHQKEKTMARLTACHTCHRQVSTNAFVCPHCGQTFARPWIKLSFIGILATIAWAVWTGIYQTTFLLDEAEVKLAEAFATTAFFLGPSENSEYYTFHQFPYGDRLITTATPKHYRNLHSFMNIAPDFLICKSNKPSLETLDPPTIDETSAICPPGSSPLELQ